MKERFRRSYEFGPFRLDPAERRLSQLGVEVQLRRRLFDLLVDLVEHHGHVVEKGDLFNRVWGGTVVEDSNLTVSINALRRVLGDGYIETVAGHGYRFTAAVKELHIAAGETKQTSQQFTEPGPTGGALPLHSHLYIDRPTDKEFYEAMLRRDSIVLVKGARQVGKTSLLARGLQRARETGATVVVTDLQHLTAAAFETIEQLLLSLAELIADQLDLPVAPHEMWNSYLSPSSNFERYLRREALTKIPSPLIWGLDEVDKIFNHAYTSDFFGLIRSWHNLRALDPDGPWPQLTVALAYATEAHLFITDLNQSPFNVGTRLTLDDFTVEQAADLNHRHGGPLQSEDEVIRFYNLTGGHPYLTQRGLYEMARRSISLSDLEYRADQDEWIFGDHLQRMLVSLERDTTLYEALRANLQTGAELPLAAFYRLRSAGVLSGDSPKEAKPRCELYDRYLKKHLL